ncbi:heavy metal-associated isoprenylated plant protein 9-like [Zingiber officinale]|uniref:heavy metal-associated isoprenylated plant protein 9-like n=1 Tax=Zingiber officinale TaxID=94328 RepID=UPI001C4CB267|nr:heavy metal-associated isoprenylated plant protein 9-like [Zingiber officinale]
MGEEAKQEAEAKQEENKEKKTEETKPGPAPSVVLSLDLHCVGCAKKIEKCMLKCTGVESVEVDMVKNQVTVKGVVDSQSLCSRIHKRTRRKVQVVSQPTAETEGDSMPEVVPPQESSMATIELLVYMHCEICAELLKRKILKMKGE